MIVREGDVPYMSFADSGLRYCTPKIKSQIDTLLKKTFFEKHLMPDITPISLYFICLITAIIPNIDVAFLNAPWEPKIAKRIYPKIWQCWREGLIKELIFLGNNNWTSDECEADRPGWFVKNWEPMESYVKTGHITIQYVKENFINRTTNKTIDGKGKKFCVVHCRRR